MRRYRKRIIRRDTLDFPFPQSEEKKHQYGKKDHDLEQAYDIVCPDPLLSHQHHEINREQRQKQGEEKNMYCITGWDQVQNVQQKSPKCGSQNRPTTGWQEDFH